MTASSYEPWNMLQRVNEELGRVLDEGRTGGRPETDGSSVVTSHWTPAVDIKEEPDRYVLTADLPGVAPGEIEITMENGMLVIKGERSFKDEKELEGFRRVERVYGSFYRRFSLPDTADPDGIEARSEHGVLLLTIPKRQQAKPRRISVGD